jgi:hypothetical protein
MNKFETSFGSTEKKNNSARGLIVAALMMATAPAMAAEPGRDTPKNAPQSQIKLPRKWKNVEEGVYAYYGAKTLEEKKSILVGLANQFPMNVLVNRQAIPSVISAEILSIAAKNAASGDPVSYLEFVTRNGSDMIREDMVKLAVEKILATEPARIPEFSALINLFPAWGPDILARSHKAAKSDGGERRERLVKK